MDIREGVHRCIWRRCLTFCRKYCRINVIRRTQQGDAQMSQVWKCVNEWCSCCCDQDARGDILLVSFVIGDHYLDFLWQVIFTFFVEWSGMIWAMWWDPRSIIFFLLIVILYSHPFLSSIFQFQPNTKYLWRNSSGIFNLNFLEKLTFKIN